MLTSVPRCAAVGAPVSKELTIYYYYHFFNLRPCF